LIAARLMSGDACRVSICYQGGYYTAKGVEAEIGKGER
jgi:hypothetical protein